MKIITDYLSFVLSKPATIIFWNQVPITEPADFEVPSAYPKSKTDKLTIVYLQTISMQRR